MIKKITWSKIVDLLLNAQSRIVIIMPAIHEEWIEIISNNRFLPNLDLSVCIDNNESVIRNGYGSIKSIDELIKLGATIKECGGLRVNFICADNEAHCLFLESRILAGDPEGYNAIEMDRQASDDIIAQFFPKSDDLDMEVRAEVISESLKESKVIEIKEAVLRNPPEEPDLKRKIATYNTLFQYAELHLEGGNLSAKTISIPSDALPFKDVELKKRLKTRISLFTKEITDQWTELSDLRTKVEEVRKKYLVTCNIRKEKSILKKENKLAFKKAIVELEILALELSQKLQNKVQTAINNSEDTLRNELTSFFAINPPDSLKNLNAENTQRHIGKEITKIISRIKLPDASQLISNIKINQMYYELTWEDLNDKAFHKWFVEKGLISKVEDSKIANFSNAFKIRK